MFFCRTRFHALIFLEEVEMKKSFEQYKSSALWIQQDERGFSIPCTKIKQLRPPISIGEYKQIDSPIKYVKIKCSCS